jgi:hypothetical protein
MAVEAAPAKEAEAKEAEAVEAAESEFRSFALRRGLSGEFAGGLTPAVPVVLRATLTSS